MTILNTGGTGMLGKNMLETAAGLGLRVLAPRRSEFDLSSRENASAWQGSGYLENDVNCGIALSLHHPLQKVAPRPRVNPLIPPSNLFPLLELRPDEF